MHPHRIALIVIVALGLVPHADAAWVQHPAPVITPTLSWEQTNVQEPSVVYSGGRFQMWYSAGNEGRCVMGYAESTDGLAWVKRDTPVMGWGHGGVKWNACHSNVQRIGGVYYAWFVTNAQHYGHDDGNIYASRSVDGVHWTPLPRAAIRMGGWAKYGANTYVVRDGARWRMFWEAFGAVGARGLWRLASATSTDLINWKVDRSVVPGLGFGDTFGGPAIVRERNGWTMYLHVPPPTPLGAHMYSLIYEARSTDLRRWKMTPAPIVLREQPSWQHDQIADPTIALVNGQRFMFFDGLNNAWPVRASIGLAVLR